MKESDKELLIASLELERLNYILNRRKIVIDAIREAGGNSFFLLNGLLYEADQVGPALNSQIFNGITRYE